MPDWLAWLLVVWLLVQFPLGCLVGRRLAGLNRRHGGSTARARASERGRAATVERAGICTGCSTAGKPQAVKVTQEMLREWSRTTALGGSTFVSVGTPGARIRRGAVGSKK